MKRPYLPIAFGLMVAGCSDPAMAHADNQEDGEAISQQAQQFVGRYNLRGQMETASGLRLNADGSFDWYLIVGSMDLFAKGTWLAREDIVELQFGAFEGNLPPSAKAGEKPIQAMTLRSDGDMLIPKTGFSGAYFRVKPPKSGADPEKP